MATSEQNTKMAYVEAVKLLEGLYEKQFCHCVDCHASGIYQQDMNINEADNAPSIYIQQSDEPILGWFVE